jgi:2'-5' RNA ligase
MQRWIRTFVAAEAPGDISSAAMRLISRLKAAPARVRWVDPPLHFTLKFLGDVDVLEIPDVCAAVGRAVSDLPAFDLEIQGAGAFPNPDRPRTVWIGTGEGTEEMVELHQRVEDSLAELGFRAEGRRFRPHLTIGRVRRSPDDEISQLGQAVRAEADFVGGVMRVDELLVFSSRLERNGPVYEVLGRAELG